MSAIDALPPLACPVLLLILLVVWLVTVLRSRPAERKKNLPLTPQRVTQPDPGYADNRRVRREQAERDVVRYLKGE